MPSTGISVSASTSNFPLAAFTPAAAIVQKDATPLLTNATFFLPEDGVLDDAPVAGLQPERIATMAQRRMETKRRGESFMALEVAPF